MKDFFFVIAFTLCCVSCSTVRTGTWTFVHEDGSISSGVWKYQSNRVISNPWLDVLESATGNMIVWWRQKDAKYLDAFYKDGEPDGAWRVWHANGMLKCDGRFDKGRRVGVWSWWDNKGNIENKEIFEENVHTIIYYWPNGRKKSLTSFKGDSPYGAWIDWDERGNILKKEMFDPRGSPSP